MSVGIKLLCTLGPSSLNDSVVAGLEELGVDLFRLNLSHIPVSMVAPWVEYLQSRTPVPICLDTDGARIRTVGTPSLTSKDVEALAIGRKLGVTHAYAASLVRREEAVERARGEV